MRKRSKTAGLFLTLCIVLALVAAHANKGHRAEELFARTQGTIGDPLSASTRRLAAPADYAHTSEHETVNAAPTSDPYDAANFAPSRPGIINVKGEHRDPGCELDAVHREKFYNPEDKTWIIDDKVWDDLSHRLDFILDCAVDDDFVLFKSDAVLQPKRKATIKTHITLSAYVEDVTTIMQESPDVPIPKAILTCPGDSDGIFIVESTGVTFANLAIQDCQLEREIPLVFEACNEYAVSESATFFAVDFTGNSHVHGSPAIKFSSPSCYQIDFNNVRFTENSCGETTTAVVEALDGAKITATNVEASKNLCPVFLVAHGDITVKHSSFLRNKGVLDEEGMSEARGTAIRLVNASTGVIEDSVFKLNEAKYGGSILVESDSTLTGTRVEFRENSAIDGGALNLGKATANLIDCSFYSNLAEEFGGGIANMEDAELDGQGLYFEGNKAKSGGALMQQGSTSVLKLSEFHKNTAEDHGGAIYTNLYSVLQASQLTMTKQKARAGGVLYLRTTTGIITDSTFEENVAAKEGGAVYMITTTLGGSNLTVKGNRASNGGGLALYKESHLDLSQSILTENKGSTYGGGALLTESSTIDGRGLEFISNSAAMGGGLALNTDSETSLKKTRFEDNSGNTAGGGICILKSVLKDFKEVDFIGNRGSMGGGIFSQTGIIDIVRATFSSNAVSSDGGGIYLNRDSTLTADTLTFEANTAGGSGGGLYVTLDSTATLKESTLADNTAKKEGGAFMLSKGTLTCEALEIAGNEARLGAGMFLEKLSTATITSCQLRDNVADDKGGALYVKQSTVTATDLTIEGNSAELGGAGVLVAENSEAKIESSTLQKNAVTGTGSGGALGSTDSLVALTDLQILENSAFSGGALHFVGGRTVLDTITVSGNSATLDGGGIFAENSELDATNSTIEDNTAEGRGGGICALSQERLALTSCTLARNTAGKTGGAIHVRSPGFIVKTLAITDNEADSGGGVYFDSSESTLQDVKLLRNTAEKEGGALYSTDGTLEATLLAVEENKAANGAGIVVKKSDRVTLQQVDFIKNIALENGGALSATSAEELSVDQAKVKKNEAEMGSGFYIVKSTDISVTNSQFEQNTATGNGAALYVERSEKVTVEAVEVTQNEAEYGAGYYLEDVKCSLVSNTFTSNVALKHGGAINTVNVRKLEATSVDVTGNRAAFGGGFYIQETKAELSECKFTKNKGDDAGGAIYGIMTSTIKGEKLTFEKNRATYGGAIYASEVDCDLADSSFADNKAEYDGGAMAVVSESSLVGNLLVFERNEATNGGAVKLQFRSNVTLTESSLTENAATESGGAFYVAYTEHLSWTTVTFSDNSAEIHGGAAYFKDVFDATIREVQFNKNTAANGGALYAAPESWIDASECVFEANQALKEGGAALLANSMLVGTDTRFTQNVAAFGGAVYLVERAGLKVQSFIFEENEAKDRGGGLYVRSMDTQTDCQIEDSTFHKNRARFGGNNRQKGFPIQLFGAFLGALHFARSEDQSTDCKDSFSGLCHGIEVWNTAFTENEASLSGAIALLSDPYGFRFACERRDSTEAMVSLTPLVRKEASAQEVYCSNWKDNVIPYLTLANEEFGSSARDVVVDVEHGTANSEPVEHRTHEPVVLDRVLTGLPLPTMKLKAVDDFGNELDPSVEDQFWAKLVAPEGFFRRGTEIGIQVIDGQEMFADIISDPEPGDYTLHLLYGNSVVSGSVPVEIHVTGCPPGQTMALDHTCHQCGPREFSRGGDCMLCPEGAECHGQYILPDGGRWHKTPCQTHTQPCLIDEACQSVNRTERLEVFGVVHDTCDYTEDQLSPYEDILCKEGYGSALCGSCEGKYGPLSKWKCVKCLPLLWNVVLYISVVLWLAVLAYVQIRRHAPTRLANRMSFGEPGDPRIALLDYRGDATTSAVGNNANGTPKHVGEYPPEICEDEEAAGQSAGPRVVAASSGPPNPNVEINRFAELVKVLMNYLQLSAILSSLNVSWMSSIKRTFEIAESLGGVVTLVTSYVSDCVLSRYWSLSRPLLRFVTAICTPFFVSLILIMSWALYNAATKRAFTAFPSFVLLTFSTVSYVSYLGLTKIAVKMFYCVSVYDSLDYASDDRTKVLAFDTSVECFQGVHWTLLGLSCVVLALFTIGFPLVTVLRIKHRVLQGGLRASSVGNTLGFLFWPFQRKLFYWEVFVFSRKAILAAICVFSRSLGGNQQQVMAAVVLLIFLYLQVSFNPYSDLFVDLNFFESSSLFLSTVSVSLGMIFGDDDPADHARVIVALVLAVCNVLYLFCFAVAFARTIIKLRAARAGRAI